MGCTSSKQENAAVAVGNAAIATKPRPNSPPPKTQPQTRSPPSSSSFTATVRSEQHREHHKHHQSTSNYDAAGSAATALSENSGIVRTTSPTPETPATPDDDDDAQGHGGGRNGGETIPCAASVSSPCRSFSQSREARVGATLPPSPPPCHHHRHHHAHSSVSSSEFDSSPSGSTSVLHASVGVGVSSRSGATIATVSATTLTSGSVVFEDGCGDTCIGSDGGRSKDEDENNHGDGKADPASETSISGGGGGEGRAGEGKKGPEHVAKPHASRPGSTRRASPTSPPQQRRTRSKDQYPAPLNSPSLFSLHHSTTSISQSMMNTATPSTAKATRTTTRRPSHEHQYQQQHTQQRNSHWRTPDSRPHNHSQLSSSSSLHATTRRPHPHSEQPNLQPSHQPHLHQQQQLQQQPLYQEQQQPHPSREASLCSRPRTHSRPRSNSPSSPAPEQTQAQDPGASLTATAGRFSKPIITTTTMQCQKNVEKEEKAGENEEAEGAETNSKLSSASASDIPTSRHTERLSKTDPRGSSANKSAGAAPVVNATTAAATTTTNAPVPPPNFDRRERTSTCADVKSMHEDGSPGSYPGSATAAAADTAEGDGAPSLGTAGSPIAAIGGTNDNDDEDDDEEGRSARSGSRGWEYSSTTGDDGMSATASSVGIRRGPSALVASVSSSSRSSSSSHGYSEREEPSAAAKASAASAPSSSMSSHRMTTGGGMGINDDGGGDDGDVGAVKSLMQDLPSSSSYGSTDPDVEPNRTHSAEVGLPSSLSPRGDEEDDPSEEEDEFRPPLPPLPPTFNDSRGKLATRIRGVPPFLSSRSSGPYSGGSAANDGATTSDLDLGEEGGGHLPKRESSATSSYVAQRTENTPSTDFRASEVSDQVGELALSLRRQYPCFRDGADGDDVDVDNDDVQELDDENDVGDGDNDDDGRERQRKQQPTTDVYVRGQCDRSVVSEMTGVTYGTKRTANSSSLSLADRGALGGYEGGGNDKDDRRCYENDENIEKQTEVKRGDKIIGALIPSRSKASRSRSAEKCAGRRAAAGSASDTVASGGIGRAADDSVAGNVSSASAFAFVGGESAYGSAVADVGSASVASPRHLAAAPATAAAAAAALAAAAAVDRPPPPSDKSGRGSEATNNFDPSSLDTVVSEVTGISSLALSAWRDDAPSGRLADASAAAAATTASFPSSLVAETSVRDDAAASPAVVAADATASHAASHAASRRAPSSVAAPGAGAGTEAEAATEDHSIDSLLAAASAAGSEASPCPLPSDLLKHFQTEDEADSPLSAFDTPKAAVAVAAAVAAVTPTEYDDDDDDEGDDDDCDEDHNDDSIKAVVSQRRGCYKPRNTHGIGSGVGGHDGRGGGDHGDGEGHPSRPVSRIRRRLQNRKPVRDVDVSDAMSISNTVVSDMADSTATEWKRKQNALVSVEEDVAG